MSELTNSNPSCISEIQLWSLDDQGFHLNFSNQVESTVHRELAREACIKLKSITKADALAVPLKLSTSISCAIIVVLTKPIADLAIEGIKLTVERHQELLHKILSNTRLKGLSVDVNQTDLIGQTLHHAHLLESTFNKREELKKIHALLKEIMYAENFYCATLNDLDQCIHFDYFSDQYDQTEIPIPLQEGLLRGSMTAYIIKTGKVIRGKFEDLVEEMGASGEITYGHPTLDWLGVPLMVGDKAFGALVIQSYDPKHTFKDNDPSVFSMVADAIASSLYRRKIRESLELKVEERTQSLALANSQLKNSLVELQSTQAQLIEAEKQASMARLVSGIAHEINTPLGICITGNSVIKEITEQLLSKYHIGPLTKNELELFFGELQESYSLLENGLERTSELVKRFKELSISQNSESVQIVELPTLIEEIGLVFKKNCEDRNIQLIMDDLIHIKVNSFPTAIIQVLQKIIENSLQHGFINKDSGVIKISTVADQQCAKIIVSDDGANLNAVDINALFDPFYTTARAAGHVGIGLHIAYNIVTQKLGGDLKIEALQHETRSIVTLPLSIN